MKTLMIYGATGYTGRMTTEYAKAVGLNVVVAGRDEFKLASYAAAMGLNYKVFSVDDAGAVDKALAGISVLLNCAGPYHRTAKPLIKAALRAGVHYLDIAAELDGYYLAEQLDNEAKAKGVLLLPGSGGSVAMLGCLAGYAADQVAQPRKVSIALHVTGSMSRGSAISASENLTAETLCLRNGKLVPQNAGTTKDFDFGTGPVPCFAVTLPDLITIGRTLRIPDVETFVHVSGNAFPHGDLQDLPEGPSEEERQANRYQAAVYITDANGEISWATLETVNGYSFTPMAAAKAAQRVINGEIKSGFQTPAGLFGNGFVTSIEDTSIRFYN